MAALCALSPALSLAYVEELHRASSVLYKARTNCCENAHERSTDPSNIEGYLVLTNEPAIYRIVVMDGEDELSPKKMRSLIELKYNNINNAIAEFGSPAVIRETFISFQKHLYDA